MEMFSAIRNSTTGLAIFAVVTAGMIALTQVATSERIEHNVREAEAKALYEILPRDSIDNDLLENTTEFVAPTLLGHERPAKAYRALRDGTVAAVILPVVAPDGYSGNIQLIVGINADSTLAGVRVLAHKETPGLGDKVELKKSDWLLGFDGKTMHGDTDSSWAVKKDGGQFDQFTGATITPRAVVNAVGRAIRYFRSNRAALLGLGEEVAEHGN
ncbi:electron transport complex subunit RsxG [Marinobacterium arenosum]|uniref:electron transport complex subunit RsxG n=1 Tax=Marinobacterium arenosum TaxID=2862496 RepID=UPI001C978065|nr:electron transport complex subunit RsxG [Marinobacterium arenosum]MBY4675470.1 electron transport complex subunit RsxG [Marinobacterium arenosum]